MGVNASEDSGGGSVLAWGGVQSEGAMRCRQMEILMVRLWREDARDNGRLVSSSANSNCQIRALQAVNPCNSNGCFSTLFWNNISMGDAERCVIQEARVGVEEDDV